MTPGSFDAWVLDEQERIAAQQWNEYRARGGKMDFKEFCEELEAKENRHAE